MEMNGFLLGAGASFELGMPLVEELSITFKRVLLRNFNSPYYRCPEEISDLVRSLLEDDLLNYEEIIGRIEIEVQRNREPKLHQELHWLLGRYNEALLILLLEYHQKNLNYIKERLELFAPIREFSRDSPLWVFSLNHDLLFEIVVRYLQLPIKFGFYDSVDIDGYSFERLTRENIDSNQFSFFQSGVGINLTRLHGALDLFVHGDKKGYLKLVNEKTWDGIITHLGQLINNDAATKNYGGRVANEITYNDENGILQFLRMTIMSGKHKYSNRIQHTLDDWFLKIFQGHLNCVKNLYCIGYSFGDPHINDRLYDWLSFSAERYIIIVDPAAKEIPANFRHLKNQVTLKKMGFLQFLNEGADKNTLLKIKFFEQARRMAKDHFVKN